MIDLKDEIIKSRETRKPFVVRKAFNLVPQWWFFINYLNYAIKHPEMHRKFGDYYFALEVFDQDISNTKFAYDHIYNTLNNNHPLGVQARPAFLVSLVDTLPNMPKHSDSCDQMHTACIGESRWILTLPDSTEVIYILEPGDLIFIPTGIEHVVTSVTPRAGITFSANYNID